MCKSHLHLVSFLFVPALYYTLKFKEFFHLLVSSLFVLSDMIVEDIVHVHTKRQWCIIVFVVVCMKSSLPTNCDDVYIVTICW